MTDLTPEQRDQPTTTVELPPGVKATVQGPSTTQVQPGGSVAADAATAMLPGWAKVGAQLTAIAIILGLFTWGYVRNEHRFDEAEQERRSTSAERSAELKAFRDWTEGRQDKQQAREDEMRNRLWQALSALTIDLKFVLMKLGVYDRASEMKKGMK